MPIGQHSAHFTPFALTWRPLRTDCMLIDRDHFPTLHSPLVSMLCSSPLIISVTGVLVAGCAGLPWLPPWTLGSAWRFPHQASSPQPHLGDKVKRRYQLVKEQGAYFDLHAHHVHSFLDALLCRSRHHGVQLFILARVGLAVPAPLLKWQRKNKITHLLQYCGYWVHVATNRLNP